ncbi:hypothetical protein L1887_24307 [Cichorium endivia]|nr:hypothetical protein L1887_24307 [Cichorium endivia]
MEYSLKLSIERFFHWVLEAKKLLLHLRALQFSLQAIGMWQLLFEEKEWSLVDHWCQFSQARHNKAISREITVTNSRLLDTVWSNPCEARAQPSYKCKQSPPPRSPSI